ncbi:PucR family transcriptional regulator, partial [Burkholderia pseudomallei]
RARRVVAGRLGGVPGLVVGRDPAAAEALLQDARLTVQRGLDDWLRDEVGALPVVEQGELFVLLLRCDDPRFRKQKLA